MRAEKIRFSDEQTAVINSASKELFVSASAGSGKTTVMIERIFGIIKNQKIPVSELLIVTFTRAAAADMREKLRRRLLEEDGTSEECAFYLEQAFDLFGGDMSTLHSYCQSLVRAHFYEVGADSAFRVSDETETALRT
ncbi:MAG: UvrD-helicase domain-containing protein, partial [Firmicutes bacterium]|nr:UvrD-helicase domain-containing protein [Bacillota bacterium]